MATVPGRSGVAARGSAARHASAFAVAVAGSAVIGLPAGLIWAEVAPRAMLEVVSAGSAGLADAETRAFIGADAWFCGIAAVAGLLTGLAGYRLGVARRAGGRVLVTAGLILGAVAGAFVMQWLGTQAGHSGYGRQLASAAVGTRFPADLALGAKSALACWPMITAIVLFTAEWGRVPAREP